VNVLGHSPLANALAALLVVSVAPGCVMEVRVGDNLPDDTDSTPDEDDLDEDGYSRKQGDCDDLDPDRGPAVDPRFVERCDGIDNDCSGIEDETEDGLLVCAREARFFQRLEIDVLIVVDRSPRNDFAREAAGASVGSFLQHLVGSAFDTHIGVLTTDLDDPLHSGHLVYPLGANRPWVSGRTDSLVAATSFVRRAITESGVQLSGAEGGRAAVARAMGEETGATNDGFFRQGSPLAIVFVSAEEDESSSPTVIGFVDQLDTWNDSNRVHAIVQSSPFGCEGKESGTEGASYLDLATLTNGLTQSVCEENYGPFFSAIGQYSAIQGLGTRFSLGEEARGESLEVELTLPGTGFARQLRNDEFGLTDGDRTLVLLLDPPPPAGTEIRVSYLRKY
jgi:hypothetical protein